MTEKNNCNIGALLLRSNEYQTWLQKKPVEIFGIVVYIREKTHGSSQYPMKYLIIRWDDKPNKDEWVENKVFGAHLKSGFIRIASEG